MRKPEWIKEQLTQSGKSQRELADALSVDPSAVSRLLNGQRKLRDRELPLLLQFFNAPAPPPEGISGTADWTDGDRIRAERLTRALQRSGMDLQRLASSAGVPAQRLIGVIDQTGQPLDWALAEKLSLSLDFSSVSMMTTGDVIERSVLAAKQRRQSMGPGGSQGPPFPIFAAPIFNPDSGFYESDFSIAEWSEPPPQLAPVERAFGMFIGDDNHQPRFLAGEVIYLHPGRPGRPGTYTLAVLEDGGIAIGRIKSISPTTVRVVGGGEREVSFPLADRPRMYRIVGSWFE